MERCPCLPSRVNCSSLPSPCIQSFGDLLRDPPLMSFPGWEVLSHPVGSLYHCDGFAVPACAPVQARQGSCCAQSPPFPRTFSSSLRCGEDQGRCRAQGVSNLRSSSRRRDVHPSLSSTACAAPGRRLCAEVPGVALGAPSRAVRAPSNPSLCAQSQRVKCWD